MRAKLATGGSLPDHSASGVAHPQGRGLVDLLLLLGVVAILSLSDFALEFFGIPYNSPGGSIIVKIHPATYLFVMALGLAVIANPNPIAYMFDLMARCLGSTFLLVACILLWIFISRFKGDQPASFLIDAIMVAAIVYMLFADVGERARLHIARAVHILMIVNCCLALVEGLSGWRLFPFVLNDTEQEWEYRATALLGHPLGGALATGVYTIVLTTVSNVRGLGTRWRVPVILLCMAAMPFIGSRVSFLIVYATVATVVGLQFLMFLRGTAISTRVLVVVLLLLPLAFLALFTLYEMGVFDNFLNRFINDKGSARSRLELFKLFEDISLRNLLLGYRLISLETQTRLGGLAEGIENSWAGHALRYGVVMTAVLWFGIAGWFVDMLRAAGRGAILPLAYIFLILSTTVGISGKSNMMSVPAVIMLALIGKGREAVSSGHAAGSANDVLSRIGRGTPVAEAGGVRLPSQCQS